MLVLTRKPGQSIVIPLVGDLDGKQIEITVTEIAGDRVRLGFNAHSSIEIFRTEVYEQILAEECEHL